ncbi:MAG: metallophosphoesterase family protein [Lachnospiraceae bacterium]|nr:metallophosphoesterase family protein [Lachnospiraceae bacterium]
MRYYISDLHFFHSNLNDRMDKRGFASGEDMNEYMIRQWNDRVHKNDEVIILGDLSIGKAQETNEIINRLKGKLYLITGNHDCFLQKKEFDTSRFVWIKTYGEIHDNNRRVILSHYPVFCYNGQYLRDKKGNPRTYMLYGHVHNTYDEFLINQFIQRTRSSVRKVRGSEEPVAIPCNMINCFCVFSDYVPLTLDEWIELDKKRRSRMREEDFGDALC